MVSLQLLAGASIRTDQGPVTGEAAQARRIALLALLAVTPNGAVGREKLIGSLWPDVDPERGRHLLSEAVYQLRKALGADSLISEGDTLRLDSRAVTCDAVAFEALANRGEHQAALEAYPGPFLDGFTVRNAPDFEQWAESERRRLEDLAAEAREALALECEGSKDYLAAARHWKRLIAHDPYNSRYVVRRMWALASSGDPGNAIQESEEHARLLREDLDAEPPKDLLALADWLREDPPQAEVARAVRTGEAGDEPLDLQIANGSQSRGWRTATLALVGAVALVASLTLLRNAYLGGSDASAPDLADADPALRVAVLPFDYSGGDEYAYLGASLASLVSTMLDGVGGLTTAHPRTVAAIAARLESEGFRGNRAREIAERTRSHHYVTAEVVELGDRLRIDARLHTLDEQSGIGALASVEGEADQFFRLLDRLGRRLLLGLIGTDREYHAVAARTTDSLSALKAYLDGVAKRRRFAFDSAVVSFRRATEIDSTFALAWYGWGVAAAWIIPEWEAGVAAAARAVRHSENLPLRIQRVIRANAEIMQGNGLEAERLSRLVLADYPDDVQAWWLLAWSGSFYPFYGRPMRDVRTAAMRAYRLDPDDPDHIAGAAHWAAVDSDWALLEALWGADDFVVRAVRAFGSGDTESQVSILAEAPNVEGYVVATAASHLVRTRGDIQAAVSLQRVRNIDHFPPEKRARAVYLTDARWSVSLGRWHSAWTGLDRVGEFYPTWADLYRALWGSAPFAPVARDELEALRQTTWNWRLGEIHPGVETALERAHDILTPQLQLYALGRLSLKLGELEDALRFADELEALGNPPEALSFAADRALGLRAHVLFERGRLEEALEALDDQPRRIRIQWLYAAPFYPAPEDRFLRGEIYSRLERHDEALRWYATINVVTGYDSPYLAMSHFRRAEIYDRLGESGNAAEHYERFIDLWRDCDPELQPVVDDARRALQRLAEDRVDLSRPAAPPLPSPRPATP
jgi:DNA-binding SARP family transcriptional activator/TolB-like protein